MDKQKRIAERNKQNRITGMDKQKRIVGLDEPHRMNEPDEQDRIVGRNAVIEALRVRRPIDKVYLDIAASPKGYGKSGKSGRDIVGAEDDISVNQSEYGDVSEKPDKPEITDLTGKPEIPGKPDKTLSYIAAKARAMGAVVSYCDRRKLDAMSGGASHQGVVAVAAALSYASVDDMLRLAQDRNQPPLIVALDEVSDVQNVGAVIRSAECAGAHGVLLPKRRSAGLTPWAYKVSSGAAEYLPVGRVSNLVSSLKGLKKQGLWIYGAAAEAPQSMWETDFSGPCCLVIGSEGSGLGRLVRETCDFMVGIPLKGRVNSLNASAAAAVLLYEILRQRSSNTMLS